MGKRDRRSRVPWWGALVLLGCAGLLVPLRASGRTTDDDTRARMAQIFESMRVLLPLSANESDFASAENRAQVLGALQTLAGNADQLAAHAGSGDAGRRYLGRSLGDDARRALERYQEGRTQDAAYVVQQATENCVACHTKLQSPGDSPLAARFVDEAMLADLPPTDRARLLVATRQFDAAQAVLEQAFADPAIPPQRLTAPLVDYLVIAIRVKDDPARPVPVLEKLAARPDLWPGLREDVMHWIESLRALASEKDRTPDLAAARRHIDEARTLSQGASRAGLVQYLVASRLLHRFLDAGPASTRDAAEAWYLLGVTESRTARGFWVSQADLYLETAVRADPRSPAAAKAYALLEENVISSYSGSSGVNVPARDAARLAELRALMGAP